MRNFHNYTVFTNMKTNPEFKFHVLCTLCACSCIHPNWIGVVNNSLALNLPSCLI